MTLRWMIAGAPELHLKVASQIASGRRGENVGKTSLQCSALGSDRRGRKSLDALGQGKGPPQPKAKPRGQHVLARLVGVGEVAGKMGKTGLMRHPVSLLGRVAIGTPDLRPMAVHRSRTTTAPRVVAARWTGDEKRWRSAGDSGWKQELMPTGRLVFEIKPWQWPAGLARQWLESEKQPIENMQPEILITFVAAGPLLVQQHKNREAAERERQLGEKRRYEEQQRRKRDR